MRYGSTVTLAALTVLLCLGLAPPADAPPAPAGDVSHAPTATRVPADTVAPASAAEVRSLADSLAEGMISEGRTAAVSMAVIRGADTLVHAGWGDASVELDAPATAETVYRIGSLTKQFTAALLQRLAAAGSLSGDDTLARWIELPEAWRSQETPVTLRHLLTHTSGIPSYTSVDAFWEESALPLSHEEVLDFVREDSLQFTPGTDWSYSNTGYYLLGMVAEEVTGRPYDDVLRDSLLAPLGLERTSYCWRAPVIQARAAGYARSDSVPGVGKLEAPRLVNARPLSMAPPFSAGALCSTVGELVEWTRALHGGDVLAPERLGEMTTEATLADGEGAGYGFGLSVSELGSHRKLSHGGGINGFSSVLAHYPEEEGPGDDLTVAVLANADGAPVGRTEEELARAVLGVPAPEVADLPVPASLTERVTGRYLIAGELPTEVRLRDGKLFAQAEGQREWRMLYQGTEETDQGPAAVFRAEFDPERVKLEFLLPEEPGTPSPAFVLYQAGQSVRAERVAAENGG